MANWEITYKEIIVLIEALTDLKAKTRDTAKKYRIEIMRRRLYMKRNKEKRDGRTET